VHEIRSSLVRGERRSALATKGSVGRSAGGGLSGVRIRREETRRCDQRGEGRHVNVVDRAVVTWQRRNYEVAVLNVSSRGAMIESGLLPRIGARVDIRFADCNRTRCYVRWVRDGRIGLEFDSETLVIAAPDVRALVVGGRREGEQPTVSVRKQRPVRQSLILRGELHSKSGSMAVRLRNISAEGAMLEGSLGLRPDTEVVLELAGAAAAPGRVRWCRAKQIGIRFDHPFDLTSLAPTRPQEAPQSPEMLKPDYLQTELEPDSPWAARWERLTPGDL